MKRVVIGTAGHVDHGKTSLIKALTGVDCDRLKEEKARGLTIELGFTSLTLPSGEQVGVVDVPGHIKFIRHMLSGASGIDLVVLVVAADEGIMPQTVEHIQICELLGIERGVVALTKVDMVDAELFELAQADVAAFIQGTFLENAPIVPVSALTRQGLDDLVAAIEDQVAEVRERQVTGLPILPIDRAFTIKGFGTVVTGTLARGRFLQGQEVEVLPHGITAKIRTLEVHDHHVEQALAGMRTAVNLQGVDKEQIVRGTWLVPAGIFTPTRVLDAKLTLIAAPPKRGGIRVHMGTAETLGSMTVHTVDGVSFARLRFKEPLVAVYGDRFIIRGVSPGTTIGGGMVLNPCPERRFAAEVAQALLDERPSARILALARDAGVKGISRHDLAGRLAETDAELDKALHELMNRAEIVRYDTQNDLFVAAEYVQMLKQTLCDILARYHAQNPTDQGMPKEHLRSALKGAIEPRLFHKILLELAKAQVVVEQGPSLRLAQFEASLGSDQDLSAVLYGVLDKAGLEPPSPVILTEQLKIPEKKLMQVLGFMVREGRAVKVKDDIYLTDAQAARLREIVKTFMQAHGPMTPGDMKTIAGVSRKYAIPFMEYLDRIRFTIRVGDARKLIGG